MIRFTSEKIPSSCIKNWLKESRGGWKSVKSYLSIFMPCSVSFIILQGTFYLLAHENSFIPPPAGVSLLVHPVKAQ